MFLFTPVPVKTEEEEEELQSSQLHQRTSRQTEAGAGGAPEDGGRAEPAPERHLHPEAEVKPEDSSGAETDDSDDWREVRESQGRGGFSHGAATSDFDSRRILCPGSEDCDNNHMKVIRNNHDRGNVFSDPGWKNHEEHLSQHVMVNNRELKQEDPVSTLIKEEEEEVWISQDSTNHLTFTSAPVKREDDEEKPQLSDESEDSDFWTETRKRRPIEEKVKEVPKAPRRTYDCSECGRKFLWNQNLIHHMRRHTGEKPFSCSFCSKRFAQKGNLQRHLVVHVKEKPFSCLECGKNFKKMSYMKRHMATHKGEKPLCCRICEQRFSWYNQLKRHICVKGQASDLHQNQSETKEVEPGLNEEDHSGEELVCNSDPKKHLQPEPEVRSQSPQGSDDSTDSDTSTETRELQPGSKSRKKRRKSHCCPECGKRFFGNHNLVHHMRVHSGEKPFSCSFCSKTFAQKGNLTRHLMVHVEEKPFSCFECGKKFREISYMKRHIAIHKGEKPLSCRGCLQRFSWYYQLKRHRCVKGQASDLHRNQNGGTKEAEPGGDEEGHRGVELNGNLDSKGHLQSQAELRIKDSHGTDESGDSDFWTETRQRRPIEKKAKQVPKAPRRTYDCSQCGKKCKAKRLLTQHMRRHTGEKPFSCSICRKSFKHKPYLNLHMANHRGEKRFSCSICDQSFTWCYQLQRHQCETGQDPQSLLNQTAEKPEAGGSVQARNSDPERHLQLDTKVKTEDSFGA